MTHKITKTLITLQDTQNIAEILAQNIQENNIITLSGDLGAGKTSFAKYFIHYLTQDVIDDIISPTFTLLQTYESAKGTIHHYDLYRLNNEEELYELGFEESIMNNICIIEWPEIASSFLPDTVIDIHIKLDYKNQQRSFSLSTDNNKIIKQLDEAV